MPVQGQKTNVPKKPAPDGVYADYGTARRFAGGNDLRRRQLVDIETGRAAGNSAVGVLWGFRDEEERGHIMRTR